MVMAGGGACWLRAGKGQKEAVTEWGRKGVTGGGKNFNPTGDHLMSGRLHAGQMLTPLVLPVQVWSSFGHKL